MKEKCPKCGIETKNPKPLKYDPADPYGKYRRKAKEGGLKEKGLI
jgi:H/ACA ribonucleoprotein complex subunit 3